MGTGGTVQGGPAAGREHRWVLGRGVQGAKSGK